MSRTKTERYRTIFRRLAEKIAIVSLFASVLLTFAAADVVAVLLGPKWTAAGPILAILAILIFTELMAGCINWLFISQGRGGQLFRYSIFAAFTRIAAVMIGLGWGIEGVAAALAATSLAIQLPVHIWYGCRTGPVRQSNVYVMLFPVALGSIVGVIVLLPVRQAVHLGDPAQSLLLTTGILAAAQTTMLLATASGRQTFRDLRRGLQILLRGQPVDDLHGG